LILQAAENSPLLTKPPEDFYEKVGQLNGPPRSISVGALVNLVKGGTGINKRVDSETPGVPEVGPRSADIEARTDVLLGAQEDGDEAQATDSHDLVWKDLRVIFAISGASGDSDTNQKEFLTAMEVLPHSQLVNKTVHQLGIAKLPGVFLVSIERPLENASAVERNSRASVVSFLGGLRGGVHAGNGGIEIVEEHSH